MFNSILIGVFILTLVFTYAIYFAFQVRGKIGRFACSIDAQAFADKYSVRLQINTTEKQLTFNPKDGNNVCKICLFYNEFKMIFSPVVLNRLTAIDKNEYRDYFYESLEFITGRDKDVIIRDVKRYFILRFFTMSTFYQTLFNIHYFRPSLPFNPQYNICNPDLIMRYVPNHLKIGAKLSLVEIDCYPRYRITSLNKQTRNSSEKKIDSLRKLLRTVKYKKRLPSPGEDNYIDQDFLNLLRQSSDPIVYIESEIQRIRDSSHHLGSDRIGKCHLHALDYKLSPLFAADILNRFSRSRSDIRIILYYKPGGDLSYYTTLYHHQYTLLKFSRKIDNVEDEMLFLGCFNKAKYEQSQGRDKVDTLISILQIEWNLFCRDSQIYLHRNQTELSLLMHD